MEISGTIEAIGPKVAAACPGAVRSSAFRSSAAMPRKSPWRRRACFPSPRARTRSKPRPSQSRFSPPGTRVIARRWRPETASWSPPRPAESGRPCCSFFASGARPRWRSVGSEAKLRFAASSAPPRPACMARRRTHRADLRRPSGRGVRRRGRPVVHKALAAHRVRRTVRPLRLRGGLRRARSREMDGRPGASRNGLPLALRRDPVLSHSDRLQSLAAFGPLRRTSPGRRRGVRDVEGGRDSAHSRSRGSISIVFPTPIARSPAGRRPEKSS